MGYVQVEINIYDQNNNQIGSTMDNVNNLAPHTKWTFKAPVMKKDIICGKWLMYQDFSFFTYFSLKNRVSCYVETLFESILF